jgi:site-specific DNA-methyltransferase (adenine-specific)
MRLEVGTATLILGDCMEVLPTLQQPVDMVLADLPYGTTRNKWDSVLPLPELWEQYGRLCKGAVVLTAQAPFSAVLGASNTRDLRYEWIWEKSNATGHLNARIAPLKAHENVLVFYKKPPTYNPQKTTGHVRKTATKRKDVTTNYGAQKGVVGVAYDSTERYPRSVLRFPSDKQRSKLHPTQKPLGLMRYLVATYTNPGDIVLDNTMGSGTTGVACAELGRRFIGIDIDPVEFEKARKRITEAHYPTQEAA